MSAPSLHARIAHILSAEDSPMRSELAWMAFDALAEQPVSTWLGDRELLPLLMSALSAENTARMAARHVLPAAARIGSELETKQERVRDALPERAEQAITRLVAEAQGPRFNWLKGAIDPADLRELLAPVLQQVLVQFASKLPLPGLGGADAGAAKAGAALGGLVGMLGKQMQKSAGQLADVGKSVIGGLGGELERRMHSLARDFSQSAMGELRQATEERLKSAEGQAILARMRDRLVTHIFDAELSQISRDFLRAPLEEIAALAPDIVAHNREQSLFQRLVELELTAALEAVGARSLTELLTEAGLFEAARALVLRAVDPAVKSLFASPRFEQWLGCLIAEAEKT